MSYLCKPPLYHSKFCRLGILGLRTPEDQNHYRIRTELCWEMLSSRHPCCHSLARGGHHNRQLMIAEKKTGEPNEILLIFCRNKTGASYVFSTFTNGRLSAPYSVRLALTDRRAQQLKSRVTREVDFVGERCEAASFGAVHRRRQKTAVDGYTRTSKVIWYDY